MAGYEKMFSLTPHQRNMNPNYTATPSPPSDWQRPAGGSCSARKAVGKRPHLLQGRRCGPESRASCAAALVREQEGLRDESARRRVVTTRKDGRQREATSRRPANTHRAHEHGARALGAHLFLGSAHGAQEVTRICSVSTWTVEGTSEQHRKQHTCLCLYCWLLHEHWPRWCGSSDENG